MLVKFIYITGVLDIILGLVIAASAFEIESATQFSSTMTLGAFLVFAGVLLMWSSKDLAARASVVVWQAMVRFWAAAWAMYFLYSGAFGYAEASIGFIDIVIASIYVIGVTRYTNKPFTSLLMGK